MNFLLLLDLFAITNIFLVTNLQCPAQNGVYMATTDRHIGTVPSFHNIENNTYSPLPL